ncbi:Heme A synthase, cytochrome oxidase biogenesis protein Cox15-CtaA [Rhodovulum sp. P5]|uniref:COX15/CtaA family protein n=1 Tax=Rhodovulum sp. P5 TaxID=1564506 RepID=UPI0009C24683|nr:COX15/CtaA family protein [Rhodovulum sp. P5]ARE39144.1 Heme A synthase, cytochrome oxidase biogenesis protein Cox15-CtaA [Rhodovulum sp. P5]
MRKTRDTKSRNIFEEVATAAPEARPLVKPGVIDRSARQGARGPVRLWLLAIFLTLAVMVIADGVVRVTGIVPEPPATTQGAGLWMIGAAHAQTATAPVQGSGWWGWGRWALTGLAGLTWLGGYLAFLISKKMPKGWAGRLIWPGALILGLVGSSIGLPYLPEPFGGSGLRSMVQSGLGFATLGVLAWFMFKLGRPEADLIQARRARDGKAFGMATGMMHFAFLQILFGALLGGLDAGRGFTDWPLMGGGVFPQGMFATNMLDNPGLVQFIHRLLGYLLLIFGIVAWLRGRRSVHKSVRWAFHWMAVMLFGQIVLGVGTVLYAAQWHIALTHQIGAVLLWGLILRARFLSQYPVQQSTIRG